MNIHKIIVGFFLVAVSLAAASLVERWFRHQAVRSLVSREELLQSPLLMG